MNEPELREAYRDLSHPVSPPPDLLVRVDHGIRRRQVVRRSVVGLAVVAVTGGAGAVVLGGSDGSRADDQRYATEPGATSTVTFTHADDSTYTFDAADLAIFCRTTEGHETLVLTRRDLVADLKADREPSSEVLSPTPLLYVEVLVDEVRPGRVFSLPFDSPTGDSSDRVMTFFVASQEGDERANEVSSAEPGASGTVTVLDASCGASPSLAIVIGGTLGSEVEQDAMAVTGEYRS